MGSSSGERIQVEVRSDPRVYFAEEKESQNLKTFCPDLSITADTHKKKILKQNTVDWWFNHRTIVQTTIRLPDYRLNSGHSITRLGLITSNGFVI